MIRQPIIAVLGHVDHGKTTLLDKIRGTSIAEKEAGKITQHIGATEIPKETLERICGEKLEKMGIKLTIPGLLFIDTPGHEAFTNLRKRGGSIADLAVLVIDINQGIQPQTKEAIDILKSYKVPFIVSANKIDLIDGWEPSQNSFFLESLKKQEDRVKLELDRMIYNLVGKLYELGFTSERFDRVKEFTKNILIIPMSAKTGEGIPDLLLYLSGLAQKFMESKLDVDLEKPGKGAILEVKDVTGLGTTIDVILYEGKIRTGDTIVLPGKRGPILTKVRALLRPKPLQEIRDPKQRFSCVDEVRAAAGIKICAPNLGDAIPGGTILVAKDMEKAKREIETEISSIEIKTGKDGVVVKADTLGSLEAVIKILSDNNISIKSGGIGLVNKKDVAEAFAVMQKDKYLGVIFAFNTKLTQEAKDEAEKLDIPVFQSDVIYKLIEDYLGWVKETKEREREEILGAKLYPAEFRILPGYVFRASKPAIVGVEILSGVLRPGTSVMKQNGEIIGKIKGIQEKGENIPEASKGMQVAVSIDGPTMGRQVKEGDTLLTYIPIERIDELTQVMKDEDMEDEVELLDRIKKIERSLEKRYRE